MRFALLAVIALALSAPALAHAQGDVQPRVVGGQTATIDEYPWQAAVVLSPSEASGSAFRRHFCGGSLITRYIVLTAAHCVFDTDPDCGALPCTLLTDPPPGDGTARIDPDDVNVVLGRTALSDATTGTEHTVRDVAFQSGYNPNNASRDVGYLVLSDPGSTQPTIDIAGPDEAAVWAPGIYAEVSGWGSTTPDNPDDGIPASATYTPSNTLRAASVQILSDATCGSPTVYGSAFIPATMLCAGYLSGGIDTCYGDSGGPLQAGIQGGGYRLAGITSWGDGCAHPNAPGVYSRVADLPLRDAIVARVDQFEAELGLPDEPIVGSGAQPRGGGPKYPPPSSDGGGGSTTTPPATTFPATTTVTSTGEPGDPFAKCRRIKNKRKRKRCNRKVRALLGQ